MRQRYLLQVYCNVFCILIVGNVIFLNPYILFRKMMESEQDKLRRRIQELSDNLNVMQKNVQDVSFLSSLFLFCYINLKSLSNILLVNFLIENTMFWLFRHWMSYSFLSELEQTWVLKIKSKISAGNHFRNSKDKSFCSMLRRCPNATV